LRQGERLVLRELGGLNTGVQAHLLPIPPQGIPGKKFTLLTNQELYESSGTGNLEVLFCSMFPLQAGQSTAVFSKKVDLSGGSSEPARLACKNAAEDRIHLPSSTKSSKYPFDRTPPFSYLQYDLEDLAEHQFVAVLDTADSPSDGWVIAEFSNISDSVIPTRMGLGRLLSAGLHMRLPANRSMLTEVKIPALDSSILAYKLNVETQGCNGKSALFAPLLRQYMPEPHESKFFVNVKHVNVNLHGVAPFMPPPLREQTTYGGVSFQLWSDPTCGTCIDLSLQVDISGSLGQLVMRYRTVMAAFPLLVVALVLRKQFKVYDETGHFISFIEGLNLCLRSTVPVLLIALSLLASSLATSRRLPPSDDPFHWRTNSTETAIDFTKNDLLLGSLDAFFWFLVPVFGLISIGVCVMVNYAALAIVSIFSFFYGVFKSKSGYIRRDDKV
jgi:GPI inositol-deacylase